jgi:hypothetical protein
MVNVHVRPSMLEWVATQDGTVGPDYLFVHSRAKLINYFKFTVKTFINVRLNGTYEFYDTVDAMCNSYIRCVGFYNPELEREDRDDLMELNNAHQLCTD